MSIVDTTLIYAAIPVGITAVLIFGVFGRSAMHQPNRYRPGRPWVFEPVWFIPHPDAVDGVVPTRRAVESQAAPDEIGGEVHPATPVGGASGEW